MPNDNTSKVREVALSKEEVKTLKELVDTLSSYEEVECILLKAYYKEMDFKYYEDPYADIMIYVIYEQGEIIDQRVKDWIKNAAYHVEFKWYIPTNNIRFYRENINDYINLEENEDREYLYNIVLSDMLYDKNGVFTEIHNKYNGTINGWTQNCKISNIEEITYSRSRI